MPIVSSIIARDDPQIDGRRWITEVHTDQMGVTYPVTYLGDAATDAGAIMLSRAPKIDADLTAREIAANIQLVLSAGATATPTFEYSTQSANITAMAKLVAGLDQQQAMALGEFIASWPDTELTTFLGLSVDQITAFRAGVANSVAGVQTSAAGIAALIAPIAQAVGG